MKKIFALILSIVVCAMLFAGCSAGDSGGVVTLSVWHYYSGNTMESFEALIQEFNETLGAENKVLVNAYSYSGVTELSDAVLDSANKAAGAPDMPDIFASYSDSALIIDEMGLVASLDDYFTQEELDSYRSEFLQEGRIGTDGALKIVPIAKSTEIFYLNATDFEPFSEATGVTTDDLTTWEGISDAAEQYHEYSDGKALFGVDSMANFVIVGLRQLGVTVFEGGQTTTMNFPEQEVKRIWDVYYKPYLQGHYTSVGRFRSDDVKVGDLLSYVGSTSSAFYFPTQVETGRDEFYEIECMTLPYPIFEGGENIAVQQGAGFVVSKSEPEREKAAALFLKWLTEKEQNTQFAASTGYMPVKNDSLVKEDVLAVMTEDDLANLSVVNTVETLYDILPGYTLFALSPFDGSYDARVLFDTALQEKAAADRELVDALEGEERDNAIEQLMSDDNFTAWYEETLGKLTAVIG